MTIYKSANVSAVQDYYGELLWDRTAYPLLKDHLYAIADRMWEGLARMEDAILAEVSNYHPAYLGASLASLRAVSFSEEDALFTTACQYGFSGLDELRSNNAPYNLLFEQAVDHLLLGELTALKALIFAHPALLHQKSSYGHKASLLHYAASNGVELWRQQVPENLVGVVRFLLDEGADVSAKMSVYKGAFTTAELLRTSAHPYAAGLGEELLSLLSDY